MSYEHIVIIFLLTFIITTLYRFNQLKNRTQSLQKELEDIFNRVIIIHFDLNGTILKVSNAYENIFGYDKKELIGVSIDKGYVSPSKPSQPIWKFLEEEGFFSGEMQLFDKEGQPYWMHKQIIKKYNNSGQHVGFISISHDITAIKLYQEQQRRIVDQSRHALMGEMISMIAHQWRQPLSTLTSITSQLRIESELGHLDKQSLADKVKETDRIIAHLSATLNDFRNFFKHDKSTKRTHIHDLVNEAIKLISFKLREIEVINHIDPEFTTQTLKGEYIQIILNLISNAADALKDIKNPRIDIKLEILEKTIILYVCDNGKGIEPEIVDRIFDPYFSTKSKNGTGLGLYICKTILQEHLDGDITVEPLEVGCCFKVTTARSI